MGCCCSKRIQQDDEFFASFDNVTQEILLDTGINHNDLHEFHDKWSTEFAFKGNEQIDFEEFTKALHVKPNALVKRLFRKYGLSNRGNELKFVEFYCFLWSLLTIHDNLNGSFLHLIYDTSSTGKMSLSDLDVFLADLKTFLDPELLPLIKEQKAVSLEETVRQLDAYDVDKKILISLRNGTDLSKQGYWAIEMANTWAIANPRVLHKFKEMKSHILTNVFGEAFWARQSKLRYANRIERKQVGYILGELKDLTTIKKTRRGFTKQEQHFKVGFKATQISPEADSRDQYETKKKNSVRKKIIKKDSWKEGDGTDEHHTEDGHAISYVSEDNVRDMITGYEITRKDISKMESKATKDSAEKHDSKLKKNKVTAKVASKVAAGVRRMSLTFGNDFQKDRAARKKQYQKDIEKLQLYDGNEEDVKRKEMHSSKNLKQKVSGTVRRLSVSMGLGGRGKQYKKK